MAKTLSLIVGRGQDIKAAIEAFVLQGEGRRYYISGAVGSAQDLVFTVPVSSEFPPAIEKICCKGPAEVLSFTGEIMPVEQMDTDLKKVYKNIQGPLFIHLHAAVAVKGGEVFGGGLYEGIAFRSLRVFLEEEK